MKSWPVAPENGFDFADQELFADLALLGTRAAGHGRTIVRLGGSIFARSLDGFDAVLERRDEDEKDLVGSLDGVPVLQESCVHVLDWLLALLEK